MIQFYSKASLNSFHRHGEHNCSAVSLPGNCDEHESFPEAHLAVMTNTIAPQRSCEGIVEYTKASPKLIWPSWGTQLLRRFAAGQLWRAWKFPRSSFGHHEAHNCSAAFLRRNCGVHKSFPKANLSVMTNKNGSQNCCRASICHESPVTY